MDDFIKDMEDRFKVSIADSTMMWMVHEAMDKAHEKVKSGEGVMTRLNEISKFYELAVMQLDGCLKFVQQETESYILETSHEEVLSDLREIRDRLQCKLQETELAISEKDRELLERSDDEMKLKQELEIKEKEMDSLRASLEIGRTKSGRVEDREGEISKLKNSVDLQVMNIKQKLEPDYNLIDEEMNSYSVTPQIEKMGSDIDVLKGTLDLAFTKMHSAIFLSELGPIEKKWRWTIEKDIIAILLRGFMKNFRHNSEDKSRNQEKHVLAGFREHLSDFMSELSYTRDELENLLNNEEYRVKSTRESRNSSPPAELESFSDDESGNLVAKMIKSHEWFIKKTSEELKKAKVRDKGSALFKRQKDIICPEKRVQEVISRLNSLVDLNAKLCDELDKAREEVAQTESCDELDKDIAEEAKTEGGMSKRDEDNVVTYSLDDVWESRSTNLASSIDIDDELKILRQEKDDLDLEKMIVEDTYLILLIGSFMELHHCELWSQVKEGMYENLIEEIVKEGNEKIQNEKIKSKITEEICCIVFKANFEEWKSCIERSDDARIMTRETDRVVFSETVKEANHLITACIDNHKEEGVFRQEVDWIVFQETIKYVDYTISEHQKNEVAHGGDSFLNVVKDDAFKDFVSKKMNELEIKNKNIEREMQQSALLTSQKFLQVLEYFESLTFEKIKTMILRLEKIKPQLHPLVEFAVSSREKESIYRRAFTRRCENLRKAEAEVDMLGDQVESLVGLLEKICRYLDQPSLVLKHNVEVLEFSRLIKKELSTFLASSQ